MCTQQVLKDIMEHRGWHAASDLKETLVGKLTTHPVSDAKLKEQASFKEMVLLQDSFSASLGSLRGQDVEASYCCDPLVGLSETEATTSKCVKYLSVEHTIHALGSSIAFLLATSMLYALHGGEAEQSDVGDPKRTTGAEGSSPRRSMLADGNASRLCTCLPSGRKLETALCGRVACRAYTCLRPSGLHPHGVAHHRHAHSVVGYWVPAWSIRALRPTDDKSQDAPTLSVICQTAIGGAERS